MEELKNKVEEVLGSIGNDIEEWVKKYGIYVVAGLVVWYLYKKFKR